MGRVLVGQPLQGPQGQDGKAATVKVGIVTELEAGQAPTVTNSGNENAAILDFGIPKGVSTLATQDADGLMSSADKIKLDTLGNSIRLDWDTDDNGIRWPSVITME
ncbi:MAG: hypothetical protein LKJ31_06365 [Atopobiaceae bacterium]|jgi:hypothetical protein|nr:hypothetical protein [Atopobiaceae bacterium]